MSDKKDTDKTEKKAKPETETPEPDKVVKKNITLDHARSAGRMLLEMRKEVELLDGYICMAFALIYLQESMDLNPEKSIRNLMLAYQHIVSNPDIAASGFAEINEILLEKKIILTH